MLLRAAGPLRFPRLPPPARRSGDGVPPPPAGSRPVGQERLHQSPQETVVPHGQGLAADRGAGCSPEPGTPRPACREHLHAHHLFQIRRQVSAYQSWSRRNTEWPSRKSVQDHGRDPWFLLGDFPVFPAADGGVVVPERGLLNHFQDAVLGGKRLFRSIFRLIPGQARKQAPQQVKEVRAIRPRPSAFPSIPGTVWRRPPARQGLALGGVRALILVDLVGDQQVEGPLGEIPFDKLRLERVERRN